MDDDATNQTKRRLGHYGSFHDSCRLWLEAEGSPDARDRRLGQTDLCGHGPGRPVRGRGADFRVFVRLCCVVRSQAMLRRDLGRALVKMAGLSSGFSGSWSSERTRRSRRSRLHTPPSCASPGPPPNSYCTP